MNSDEHDEYEWDYYDPVFDFEDDDYDYDDYEDEDSDEEDELLRNYGYDQTTNENTGYDYHGDDWRRYNGWPDLSSGDCEEAWERPSAGGIQGTEFYH